MPHPFSSLAKALLVYCDPWSLWKPDYIGSIRPDSHLEVKGQVKSQSTIAVALK